VRDEKTVNMRIVLGIFLKKEPLMIKTGLKGFLETEVIPLDKIGSVETDINP
jgi:hypothetical protein